MNLQNDLFPTKFVCDVGTASVNTNDTLDAVLTVDGIVILHETYSPANGTITIRGLRSVLEAAIHGELGEGLGDAPRETNLLLKNGNTTVDSAIMNLYPARLRNPRDPQGLKTVLAAGDLVMVTAYNAGLPPMTYTTTAGLQTVNPATAADGALIGDGDVNGGAAAVRLWVEYSACPERAVAVRFLNRYDVTQTMMTPRPLDVKPAFQDQTQLYHGHRVRYAVEQQDEYTLRSGAVHSQAEYASWADLVTSRKAEVWYYGQWLPIVVTKSNFTVIRASSGRPTIEISFRMADPKQAL